MAKFLHTTFAMLFAFNIGTAFSAETIHVVTDHWSSYTEEDGTGYYFDVLRAVYPEPEYTLDIKIMPYARSIAMIMDGNADIALGLYKGEIPDEQISKYVIERDLVDALVTPTLAANWKDVNSLAGKNVVAKIGYEFDAITDVKMDYSEKANLLSMLKMLGAGRVDAVLDYEADITPALEEAGLGSEFKIINAVIGSDIFFGFSATPKGKELQKQFNERFIKLWDKKVIHQLMEKNVGSAGSLPPKQ